MKESTPAIDEYVARANITRNWFKEPMIGLPLTQEDAKLVVSLLQSDLSPENLSCDGERPFREVMQRGKELRQVGADIEAIFGIKFN